MLKYDTNYDLLALPVNQKRFAGVSLCIFKVKSKVFRHYSPCYRVDSRSNVSFGWRLTVKLQLVDVFSVEEV